MHEPVNSEPTTLFIYNICVTYQWPIYPIDICIDPTCLPPPGGQRILMISCSSPFSTLSSNYFLSYIL